jgi:hypothetical protein
VEEHRLFLNDLNPLRNVQQGAEAALPEYHIPVSERSTEGRANQRNALLEDLTQRMVEDYVRSHLASLQLNEVDWFRVFAGLAALVRELVQQHAGLPDFLRELFVRQRALFSQ